MFLSIVQTIYWWFLLLVVGLSFYPLSKLYFGRFFDRGWIGAKFIGVLILSYSLYVLGVVKLFKFSQLEIWVVLGLFFVFWRLVFRKNKTSGSRVMVIDARLVVLEIILLLLMILMSIIRGYQPEIYGLEKFMDFGFINSVVNSVYFPPKDLWWTPEPINYYYFGHLWVGVLIKMSGVYPAVGYNLALSLIFGLSLTMLIALIRTWTKNIWFAILGAVMHSGLGNLHFLSTVFKKTWDQYWYPDASRLIPGVITEFPVYSYVVYDLHAHVINIPSAILSISMLSQIFMRRTLRFVDCILLGFIFGVNFMSNAWDLPIYLFLSAIILVIFILKNFHSKAEIIRLVTKLIFTISVTALTIIPFLVFFKKVDAPILPTNLHSPIYMMLQLWGYWLILAVSFFVYLILHRKKNKYFDWFIAGLYICAILLLIIPEFIYVKDIYGADYQRANTVFKLTYQSWTMFSLAGIFTVWRIYKFKQTGYRKVLKLVWIIVFVATTVGCFGYTVRAYMTGYGEFKNFYGLKGDRYIKRVYGEDEYVAIDWLKNNTSPLSVVLEASGDSYTDYQRVSVNSGRPTVVGWAVHEWLWRGSFGPVGVRQGQVEKIYTTIDTSEFLDLINKFEIKYVYLGNLEREKYKGSPGLALSTIGKKVFERGNIIIYELGND